MVLEDEPDLLIPKLGLFPFRKSERVCPIQSDLTGRWRFERSNDVEQRALATSRRSHYGRRFSAGKRKSHFGQNREWTAGSRIFLGNL